MLLAREFQLSVDAARQLLSKARVLPRELSEVDAKRLVEALRRLGVTCEQVVVASYTSAVCATHPSLMPERPCAECRTLVCVLCTGPEGEPLCASCAALRTRRSRAKWVRVAVLLGVLVSLGVWGLSRQRSREQRLGWKRPLNVAVVLLAHGEVKPEVTQAWSEGLERLQGWMEREAARYHLGVRRPVELHLVGPTKADGLELAPPGEGLVDRALGAWHLSRELARVDKAAGVVPSRWDARIYVSLEPTESEDERFVEGMAEAGGSVGLVRGVLKDTELTLELTAVAHELFHCLGAADAYDRGGHALVPQGMVEPQRQPLYPQVAAEVMVGEVPLGPQLGRLPDSLDEVRVGPATAAALRWTR